MNSKYSLSQAVICLSNDINKMDFRQLRNEVQLLRDELAIMRRKYEDIIYNLDTDNFSSRFVKEQGDMRTAIKVTAEGIETKVSNEEFESTKTQLVNKIESEVKNLSNADAALSSRITQTADEIYATVAENYDDLDSQISSVSVKANGISTRVGKMEKGDFGDYTLFQQTNDTFLFDGNYMRISSAIQLTDNDGNHTFSIFHNEGEPYSAGVRATYMCGVSTNLAPMDPLIIGSSLQGVYLNDATSANLIATQGWVLENAGSGSGGAVVAVFG